MADLSNTTSPYLLITRPPNLLTQNCSFSLISLQEIKCESTRQVIYSDRQLTHHDRKMSELPGRVRCIFSYPIINLYTDTQLFFRWEITKSRPLGPLPLLPPPERRARSMLPSGGSRDRRATIAANWRTMPEIVGFLAVPSPPPRHVSIMHPLGNNKVFN